MEIQRDEKLKPSASDYEAACDIMSDIQNRESWSTPKVLAQWVAAIRMAGRTEAGTPERHLYQRDT